VADFRSPHCAANQAATVLSAALSAHGSAAVFVDEAATLGVAERKAGLLLGLEPSREARLA